MSFDGALDETSLYYIAMILIYTGIGPWVAARLGRGRADDRRELRGEVDATLGLVERLSAARDRAGDPERRQALGRMIERLSAEAALGVAELNRSAELLAREPDRRFVVVPTPRSALGAFLTFAMIGATYFGFMFWLTLGFDFWNRAGFDPMTDALAQQRALFLAGGGLALLVLAYCLRFGAFRLYRLQARRESAKLEAALTAEADADLTDALRDARALVGAAASARPIAETGRLAATRD